MVSSNYGDDAFIIVVSQDPGVSPFARHQVIELASVGRARRSSQRSQEGGQESAGRRVTAPDGLIGERGFVDLTAEPSKKKQ